MPTISVYCCSFGRGRHISCLELLPAFSLTRTTSSSSTQIQELVTILQLNRPIAQLLACDFLYQLIHPAHARPNGKSATHASRALCMHVSSSAFLGKSPEYCRGTPHLHQSVHCSFLLISLVLCMFPSLFSYLLSAAVDLPCTSSLSLVYF